MTTTTRLLLMFLLLVVVAVWARWYLSEKQSTPSPITQIRTAQQQTSGDAVLSWPINQEAIIPQAAIATVQPSEGAQFVPVKGAKTYALWQWNTITRTNKKIWWESAWTLTIRQGAVQVLAGKVVGGWLIVDMNSLTTTDGSWISWTNLMKSDDFFGTEQFPTASFVLQEVWGGQIVGVLTIKWVSNQLRFPAVVIVEDDSVVVTAEFALNRKQRWINGWGVEFSEFLELSFTVRFVP